LLEEGLEENPLNLAAFNEKSHLEGGFLVIPLGTSIFKESPLFTRGSTF
jgi:hypothetical protein